jgi:ribosomal protein S10
MQVNRTGKRALKLHHSGKSNWEMRIYKGYIYINTHGGIMWVKGRGGWGC